MKLIFTCLLFAAFLATVALYLLFPDASDSAVTEYQLLTQPPLIEIRIARLNVSEANAKKRQEQQKQRQVAMGCRPRRQKVPVKEYLLDNHWIKDKVLRPPFLSVKLCQDDLSYCSNSESRCQVAKEGLVYRRYIVSYMEGNRPVFTRLNVTVHASCTCA